MKVVGDMKQDLLRRISALKGTLQPLLEQSREIADKAVDGEGNPRAFTPDEFAKHKNIAKDIIGLTAELQNLETELRAVDIVARTYEEEADRRDLPGAHALPQNSAEYRETFARALCGGSNGANVEAVNRLRELADPKALTGTSPSTGAVLIPTVIVQQIMMEAEKASALMRLSDVMSTSDKIKSIPFLDELGLLAPRSEGEAYVKASPSLVAKNRTVHNFGTLFSVSQELIEDVAALENALAQQLGRSAGYTVEEYGLKGEAGATSFTDQAGSPVTLTITNKVPTGILGNATSVVPAVTAAATGAVTYDEIIGVKQAVDPTADNFGSWIMSRDMETEVLTLKDSQNRPLWQPAIAAGTPNTLAGRPYELSTRLGGLTASATPLLFGDFRAAHKIDIKRDLLVKTSEHFYFGSGMIAYAGDLRFGALVTLKNMIARLNMAAA